MSTCTCPRRSTIIYGACCSAAGHASWVSAGRFAANSICRPLAAHLIERGVHCCLPRVTDGSMTMTLPTHGAPGVPWRLIATAFPAVRWRTVATRYATDSGECLRYGGVSSWLWCWLFRSHLGGAYPRPLSIGIGFELARTANIYPAWHDVPLDAVVTEAGIEVFSARFAAECAG